jgi:hypothetical protein
MRRGLSATLAAQVALLAAVILLLASGSFLGALRGGMVPPFQQVLSVGPRLALVVENGPFCVEPGPLSACHTNVHQEFRVWYYVEGQSHEVLSHIWSE